MVSAESQIGEIDPYSPQQFGEIDSYSPQQFCTHLRGTEEEIIPIRDNHTQSTNYLMNMCGSK